MPTCIPLQQFYLQGYTRAKWQPAKVALKIRGAKLYKDFANLIFTQYPACNYVAIGFFRPYLLVVSNELSVHSITKFEGMLPEACKIVFKFWPIRDQYWHEFVQNDNRMIKIYSKEEQAKMNVLRDDAQYYE